MKRKEEIEQAALDFQNSPAEDDINTIADFFRCGAEWSDNHPNLTWENVRKICLIAEKVHKFHGFWDQSVYEEISYRFNNPELWS